MNMTEEKCLCPVCGSKSFKLLPSPWPFSMTTAGQLVSQPLAKQHCVSCGLMMRSPEWFYAQPNLYEKQYAFFDRPGAAVFDRPRYQAMAEWITGALGTYHPTSILDAGCGRGWMMRALREQYPSATFRGIEPSEQESEIARREGWSVDTAMVDENYRIDQQYDLVYCTNVVEHTMNPSDFLTRLGELTKPGGRIVVTCPDSSYPNSEFMFSDQKFSFTPTHLMRMAEPAGLHALKWCPPPAVTSMHDKQLWVFATDKKDAPEIDERHFRSVSLDQLFRERSEYIKSYLECDAYLVQSIEKCERVYNFGTSIWTMLLRAYCGSYWQRVTACVIDGGQGQFHGRPVEDFQALPLSSHDALVLGVNPLSQAEFSCRLEKMGIKSIGWSQIIQK